MGACESKRLMPLDRQLHKDGSIERIGALCAQGDLKPPRVYWLPDEGERVAWPWCLLNWGQISMLPDGVCRNALPMSSILQARGSCGDAGAGG
ncbi:hypothetical protein PVAP13_2KG230858 [Panicum virgatum]|uniref:Uncharacterized protein n=2 Tax=Panicum virgatum TaxID=38727 RepID=A0A8T0W8Q0_PANVG|nr:hypothetical protein PVAP13_2KG230858 [Panicum virgatum]